MGLLGQLAAGPVAKPAPRTTSGHVLSGPPVPQHARGPQVAPNRAPASGGSARITGPTAFPASQQDQYRRAIAETFLHQSQPTQIALIHGAMKNPTPAGTTILDFLKGTGVSKVVGHSLLYTGPGATKNVSYPYGMQSQATPSSGPAMPGATAPQASGSLSGNVTPTTFAQALLKGLGAPITPQNMQALIGWQKAEGGHWNNTAKYNPLNTTQSAPGATNTGAQGNIKAYTDWTQGLQATVKTLQENQPGYDRIRAALKAGNDPQAVAKAIDSSAWAPYAGNYTQGVIAKTPAPSGGAPASAPVAAGPQAATVPTTFGRQIPKSQAAVYQQAQDALQKIAGPVSLNAHPDSGTAPATGSPTPVQAMVAKANSLLGKPYVWGGGHGGWSASSGYDCSGFVSHVLHAGGLLSSPVDTSALPSQAGIDPGPGRFVTLYDRTAGQGHVIIDLAGQFYESGGSSGPWGGGGGVAKIAKPTAAYLGSFNTILHPRGL